MWKVNGRRTPSDGKSSHCLWQGELKSDRIKLVWWSQTSPLSEMIRSYKFFLHTSKIPTLTYTVLQVISVVYCGQLRTEEIKIAEYYVK
jgi:hypothetical protein